MRYSSAVPFLVAAAFAGCGDTHYSFPEQAAPIVVLPPGSMQTQTTYNIGGQPTAAPAATSTPTKPDPVPVTPPVIVKDTDGDGMPDDSDLCPNVAGSIDDADQDGLVDYRELMVGTDRCNADTDGDSISDGREVNELNTNPLVQDTDRDGVKDDVDVCPLIASKEYDGDGDGLMDGIEHQLGTDICNPDTDGDSISDGREVNELNTNPLSVDSDGDGIRDGQDICPAGQVRQQYTGNSDPNINAFNVDDQDNDHIPDADEVAGAASFTGQRYVTNPCTFDTDGDGRGDGDELYSCYITSVGGTCQFMNPTNPDTDSDGMLDGQDPCPTIWGSTEDWDGDGLLNSFEDARHSNRCSQDTDGDGVGDLQDEYPAQAEVPMTRGEFVRVVVSLYHYQMPGGDPGPCPTWNDLVPGNQYYTEACILALSNRGGSPSQFGAADSYRPDGTLTRLQVLEMAYNLYTLGGSRGWTPYLDIPDFSDWGVWYRSAFVNGFYAPRSMPDSGGHYTFGLDNVASRCFVIDLLRRDTDSSPYDCLEPQ